jgi:hypothetical protein
LPPEKQVRTSEKRCIMLAQSSKTFSVLVWKSGSDSKCGTPVPLHKTASSPTWATQARLPLGELGYEFPEPRELIRGSVAFDGRRRNEARNHARKVDTRK